jgi:hypothetical protein
MKRRFFSVLVLAIIISVLAFTGCRIGDDEAADNSLDGALVLTGSIYTSPGADGTPYTESDTVIAAASSLDGGESLGEGVLSDGEFSITVKKPTILTNLSPMHFSSGWSEDKLVELDPPDAQAARVVFSLKDADRTIQKQDLPPVDDSKDIYAEYDYFDYIYVDKDVTVVLDDYEFSSELYGVNYINKYSSTTIKLSEGWNVLLSKIEQSGMQPGDVTYETQISIDDRGVNWILGRARN